MAPPVDEEDGDLTNMDWNPDWDKYFSMQLKTAEPPRDGRCGHAAHVAYRTSLEKARALPTCSENTHDGEACLTRLHVVNEEGLNHALCEGSKWLMLRHSRPPFTDAVEVGRSLSTAIKDSGVTEIWRQDPLQPAGESGPVAVQVRTLLDKLGSLEKPSSKFGYRQGDKKPRNYLDLPRLPTFEVDPLYPEDASKVCIYRRYLSSRDTTSGTLGLDELWALHLPHLKPVTCLADPDSRTGGHQDGGGSRSALSCLTGYKLVLLWPTSSKELRDQLGQEGTTFSGGTPYYCFLQPGDTLFLGRASDGGPVIHAVASFACAFSRCENKCVNFRHHPGCRAATFMVVEHFLHPRDVLSAVESACLEMKKHAVTNVDGVEHNLSLFKWVSHDLQVNPNFWAEYLTEEERMAIASEVESMHDAWARPQSPTIQQQRPKPPKRQCNNLRRSMGVGFITADDTTTTNISNSNNPPTKRQRLSTTTTPIKALVDFGNRTLIVGYLVNNSLTYLTFDEYSEVGITMVRMRALCDGHGKVTKVCDQVTENDSPDNVVTDLKVLRPSDEESPLRQSGQAKLRKLQTELRKVIEHIIAYMLKRLLKKIGRNHLKIELHHAEPSYMDKGATLSLHESIRTVATRKDPGLIGLDSVDFKVHDEALISALHACKNDQTEGLFRSFVIDMGSSSIEFCGILFQIADGEINFVHAYHRPNSSLQASEVLRSHVNTAVKKLLCDHHPDYDDDRCSEHLNSWVREFYETEAFPKPRTDWQVPAAMKLHMRNLAFSYEDVFNIIHVVFCQFTDDFCELVEKLIAEDENLFTLCRNEDSEMMSKYAESIKNATDVDSHIDTFRGRLQACRQRLSKQPSNTAHFVGGGFVCHTLRERVVTLFRDSHWQISDKRCRLAVVEGMDVLMGLSDKTIPRLKYWYVVWGDNTVETSSRTDAIGQCRQACWVVLAQLGDMCQGNLWSAWPWSLSGKSKSDIIMDEKIKVYRSEVDPRGLNYRQGIRQMKEFVDLTKTKLPPKDELELRKVKYDGEGHDEAGYSLAYVMRWKASVHKLTFQILLPRLVTEGNELPETVLIDRSGDAHRWVHL